MAILFQDGFDHYNGTAAATGGALAAFGGSINSMQAGIFGGQCARHSLSLASFGIAASPNITFACHLRCLSRATNYSTSGQLQIIGDGQIQCGVRMSGGGDIYLYRGTPFTSSATGLLAISDSNAIKLNTWHYFQLEIACDDIVGRMTAWIDGEKVAEATGVDTKGSTVSANIEQINWGATYASGGGNGGLVEYDNIVVTDSATKETERRIITAAPSADGATLGWVPSVGTDHFAVVDGATVSTADYLSGSAVSDLDILSYPALPITPNEIVNVKQVAWAKMTDLGPRDIYNGVGSGATNSQGPSIPLTAALVPYSRYLPTDPNTAAAWIKADLEAATVRLEVAA
jgi:hypothetical protein